jgi:hypothetical protein
VRLRVRESHNGLWQLRCLRKELRGGTGLLGGELRAVVRWRDNEVRKLLRKHEHGSG